MLAPSTAALLVTARYWGVLSFPVPPNIQPDSFPPSVAWTGVLFVCCMVHATLTRHIKHQKLRNVTCNSFPDISHGHHATQSHSIRQHTRHS